MNPQVWQYLYENSHQLSKPAHAKWLVTEEDIAVINSLIIDVLRAFLKNEDLHVGLKIYIDNELRNDFIEKMVVDPPSLSTSLETWSHAIFGLQKFGMILMGLEEYSNSFAEKAATVVRPLLELAGLPLDGLSFLFFMGNYGFTPFGVHKEATGEDGVLFHLGPGKKQFYTWDDPKYNVIEHNSKVFKNVSEMLPNGQAYELEPGDAMFIPHYVYHVANTSEFSLSFVLDYINPPTDRFENELMRATAEESLSHQNEYEKPIKLDATLSAKNDTLDSQSIQKKLEVAFGRKILTLKSNGGIRKKSRSVKTTFPLTDSFAIRGKKIFPLYLDIQDTKKILIFARGHRIQQKNHPKLPQLIYLLNEGKSVKVAGIKELMEPVWDTIDVLSFIQELLRVEAITNEEVALE